MTLRIWLDGVQDAVPPPCPECDRPMEEAARRPAPEFTAWICRRCNIPLVLTVQAIRTAMKQTAR